MRPAHEAGVVLGLLAAMACGSSARGPRPPSPPEAAAPTVRIGLAAGLDSVTVAAPGGLRATGPEGGEVGRRGGEGAPWRFGLEGGRLRVEGVDPAVLPGTSVTLRPRRGGASVRVDGRPYRGRVEVRRIPRHGLVVVNELDLESYLLGVVPAEIGPRRPDEFQSVLAQAVAARTYAMRNLGRRDSLGFDMFGSVEDQVYRGRAAEREQVRRAVRATRGQILVHGGRPIRAYYHSTGGGRTARVTDVWNLPDAPYLRRVSDTRPNGDDFCRISPRYRWRETWDPDQLAAAVQEGIRDHFAADVEVDSVRRVEVLETTAAGRVTRLRVGTGAGEWIVTKNDIRFFLRTPDGRYLRSTRFRVLRDPAAGRGLELVGRGFGHGVGMCQWGAIGRARAGQGYREILSHYYPGTRLVRAY